MKETIAAISTARGEGGIGIIRVSGEASLLVMKKLMFNFPKDIKSRYAYFSKIVGKDNEIIDEANFIYMKAPYSYTGEDVLEIQAHGNNFSLKKILREVINCDESVRIAEPGEFTKLAFLNGKMDLSQAEAVIDIIKAKSDISLKIAENQRHGRIGNSIKNIRKDLLEVLADMAVNIDYPDEDIEMISYEKFLEKIKVAKEKIDKILKTSNIGKIAREGIRIAIIGKPNVGKSTLMNALLGEGRAIVTEIPGTTRDTIEENANIDGFQIVLIDTAGLRETEDVVEKIGIEKTKDETKKADIIMLVLNASDSFSEQKEEIIKNKELFENKKVIVVINKTDLNEKIEESKIKELVPESLVVLTSFIDEEANSSVDKIKENIISILSLKEISLDNENIVSEERHIELLKSSEKNLKDAINLINMKEPLEVIELSTHYAFDNLGEIIGEGVSEEILNTVFSKFCLGK